MYNDNRIDDKLINTARYPEDYVSTGSPNNSSPRSSRLRNPNMKTVVFGFIVIVVVIALVYFLKIKPVYDRFHDMGETIGTTFGELTGGAVGSYRGFSDGKADGKEAGLNADDTSIAIYSLQEIGKLEVLVADVKMTDLFEVGDKYKALFTMDGNVVFTVDLAKAQYDYDPEKNSLSILLPKPECELFADESTTTMLADWQKPLSNGRASEGANAYHDAAKNMQAEYKTSIANYSTLFDMAKSVASTQVEALANAANGSMKTVVVSFAP